MATITEDYVSFEIAKLLKEKGFDARCPMIYTADGEMLYTDVKHHNMYAVTNKQLEYYTDIIAPTLQMAMKWLREVYNVIPIILTGDNRHDGVTIYYWFRIDTIKNGRWKDAVYREDEIEYPTYEQACEAAIKYCLEKLI